MLNKLVAVVPDNTETYFICNDSRHYDNIILHRRMAVCLYDSKGSPCERNDFPVFMDETGRICLYDETAAGCGMPYETFTVGVPKYFHEADFVGRFCDDPESLVSVLKQLRAKKFTFMKPQSSDITLEVSSDFSPEKFYFISHEPCVPTGGTNESWCSDQEMKLVSFGRKLALFRYAFDMPDLRFHLSFGFDKADEDLYKVKWERIIEESAEKFAVDNNLK